MGEFKPDFEFRLTHSLQSLRSELIQDIAKQQQRLVSELRGEITTAFKSEAAAVAALDEQLWLTDQRLGQRIDELARAHCESYASSRASAMPTARQEPSSVPHS